MKVLLTGLGLAAVLSCCACGGGDSGTSSTVAAQTVDAPTPAPRPTPSPSPRPTATLTPTPTPTPTLTPTPTPTPTPASPTNVILFIGDGMGAETVKAASLFATGNEEGLSFQQFPEQALMTHNSSGEAVTDSAASATALATGVKVNNGVISVRLPGGGDDLPTLLELYKSQGKAVGLVTTSFIEDATPAAFAAHRASRSQAGGIASDYLMRSRPHLLMGGYTVGAFSPTAAAGGGYTVVTNRAQMNAFGPLGNQMLAGLFGVGLLPYELDGDFSSIPDLSEMTRAALPLLAERPQGFFVLIENENIDESGHANEIGRSVAATVELSEAVEEALAWAGSRRDTLIIVTSDHETGGLTVISPQGQGNLPQVSWQTQGHTATPVPLYARGPLAERFGGTLDNTGLLLRLTGNPTE